MRQRVKTTRRPDAIWWGVEWRAQNRFDDTDRHLAWEYDVRLFRTRRECRDFIEQEFGYIKTRPDLQTEPHGWRMPVAVRVGVWRLKKRAGQK